uniref:Uncharacterized protein n=1 Tax=Pseudothermotoga hypogea TaxID=57487 RepID=A0A832MMN9_9THEM
METGKGENPFDVPDQERSMESDGRTKKKDPRCIYTSLNKGVVVAGLGRLDEAMVHLDKTSQVNATFAFNCVQSDG